MDNRTFKAFVAAYKDPEMAKRVSDAGLAQVRRGIDLAFAHVLEAHGEMSIEQQAIKFGQFRAAVHAPQILGSGESK